MSKFKVGLQLFGIREEMGQDMDAALGAVKDIGYDYVEFAGYFGKSAAEVRSLLDKHGLKCLSVHQGPAIFDEQGQKAVDFLKTIGAGYCAIPSYPLDRFINNFNETAEYFAKLGAMLKENGIQLLYHNHDFEFNKIDGEYIFDKLFAAVPADLLSPEIDTCWVRYAGEDPTKYIEKYAGGISLVHLKDFVCGSFNSGPVYTLIGKDGRENTQAPKQDNGFEFRPVGYGIQDFPAILAAAEKAGADTVIVEQDASVGRTPMEASKMSRDYLKSLGI